MARENLQITITAVDKATGTFKGLAQTVGSVQKNVESLNKTAQNLNFMFLGQDLLRAARQGATGLYQLAKASSDVAEAQNFVEQVFGDSTDAILEFGRTATKSTLMSEKAILDAAATFGVFGKSIGLTDQDLAGFSKNLVQLAADMASIKNTSTDQAINAIGAAFRNEFTPIRQYGAALDEATLKAKALALGIYDGTGTLTTQQRVLATNQLLFEQLGFAIGDVDRTFDSLANQTKLTQAQFENFKANIGSTLQPAFQTVLGLANSAMNVFQGLDPAIQSAATNIVGLGTAFLGLAGVVTLAVGKYGQAKQAFRDMQESMASMTLRGRAVGGVLTSITSGLVKLGASAVAVEAVFGVLNAVNDVAGKTADAIDKVNVAVAEGNRQDAWSGFLDLAKQKDDALTFSHIITDVGKKIQLFGSDTKRPIEDLDAAFRTLLDQDPANAIAVLETMREQIEAADQSSSQTKDNISLYNRWDAQLQLTVKSLQAEGQAAGLTAEQIEQYGSAALEGADATFELQDGVDAAAKTMQEWRDSLRAVENSMTPLTDKVDAFGTAVEESVGANDFLKNVMDVADAIGSLTEKLKDEDPVVRKAAEGLDVWNETGRDQLKTLDDLAEAIGTDIVRAYEESGGSVDAARQSMEDWKNTVADQMRQAGISEPVIESYLEKLNLTDGTWESIIKLSGQEEARRKLDELNIDFQKLPPAVYTKVQAAIDQNDWATAYEIIKGFLSEPVPQPVEVTGAEAEGNEAHADIEGIMASPVDQPVETENTDRWSWKETFRNWWRQPLDQPVRSTDEDSWLTKGRLGQIFGMAVNQPVRSTDENSRQEKGGISDVFRPAITQTVKTENNDAPRTREDIVRQFQNPVTQTVQVRATGISAVAGAVAGAARPQSSGRAAAPSAAEYAATSAPSMMLMDDGLTLPQPVSAGRMAPTSTPSIITNLTVNMPVGTNEARVLDLLKSHQRNNGALAISTH